MSVTAKSQKQGIGMSEGHRKQHRLQKLLGEFFGGREKRRRIEDLVSSPVAIMQKVVESKEKGRQRTYDWCCICMEEYEFMPIDEITGEKCCVKKTAKCRLCRAIYTLWRKEKMRGKNQSGPSWTAAKLCAWENLPLHLGERPSFTTFMRTVDQDTHKSVGEV